MALRAKTADPVEMSDSILDGIKVIADGVCGMHGMVARYIQQHLEVVDEVQHLKLSLERAEAQLLKTRTDLHAARVERDRLSALDCRSREQVHACELEIKRLNMLCARLDGKQRKVVRVVYKRPVKEMDFPWIGKSDVHRGVWVIFYAQGDEPSLMRGMVLKSTHERWAVGMHASNFDKKEWSVTVDVASFDAMQGEQEAQGTKISWLVYTKYAVKDKDGAVRAFRFKPVCVSGVWQRLTRIGTRQMMDYGMVAASSRIEGPWQTTIITRGV